LVFKERINPCRWLQLTPRVVPQGNEMSIPIFFGNGEDPNSSYPVLCTSCRQPSRLANFDHKFDMSPHQKWSAHMTPVCITIPTIYYYFLQKKIQTTLFFQLSISYIMKLIPIQRFKNEVDIKWRDTNEF